jgi:lipopolysaccharide export system protein LptA
MDRDKNALREIEGDAVVLDAGNRILRVGGGEGGKARIRSAASDVAADEITILIDMNDFEAGGGVHMSFRASKPEEDHKGFFSREEPVFIDAQTMRYSSERKRFILWNQTDRVRAWQGKKVLFAQEIIAAEDGGDIACKGRILSVFPHKPKGEERERLVEISADRMSYDHGSNQVNFEDGCSLKTGNALVRCGLITVNPGEGGGEVRWIRASKGTSPAVTILMNTKEATGEFAEYDMDKDIIVLTGRPVLKEKDRGTLRGDKLTFHLADGTIRIENPDQELSVTVIKS